MRGRFAPSPTGRLHLGNLRSALLGWLQARAAGGEFLLRIEDLDPERSREEHVEGIFRDLEFLGLDWDGEVWRQSRRREIYDEALARLTADGRVYACTCSRAEIARAASAPHAGEEGPLYPGTCRPPAPLTPSRVEGAHPFTPSGVEGAPPTHPGRPASLRFRVEPGTVTFVDHLRGTCTQDVAREAGDFVVRRADGVASYQLAVVVDDALSGVTEVLRGEDLLSSTGRQLLLYRALGWPAPSYAHVPLLFQADGKRLSKREGSTTVAGLRAAGVSAEAIIGVLAGWSGLGDGTPIRARELIEGFSLERIRRTPTVVSYDELAALTGRR